MPRVECDLLVAGYLKLNLLFRSGNQDVLAFCEHLGYAIGLVLTFYKYLTDKHQDRR